MLVLLLLLLATPVRASGPLDTEQTWRAQLRWLDAPTKPVTTVTTIWEATELSTSIARGEAELVPRLEKLTRSRLPFVPGEALLAQARLGLMHARTAESAGLSSYHAGVLGSGAVLGPLPGPSSADAPAAADDARWRSFAGLERPGSLPLGDLADVNGDAHVDLAFPLIAKAATKALVVVGSSGPVSVWLDDALVLEDDSEQWFSDWQHAVLVDLAPGQHRLIVRAGHRSATPQLTVRVVDARGMRPAALGGRPGGKAPKLALTALAQAGESVRLAARVGPPYEASKSDVALAAAHAPWELAPLEKHDEGKARAFYESNPGPMQYAALVDIATRQGLPADADRFARALAAREPEHPAYKAWRALVLLETSDAITALGAVAGDPRLARNLRLATVNATLLERAERIVDAADAWARVAILQSGGSESVQRAVALYRRANRPEDALAVLAEAKSRRPYSLDLHILEARTLAVTSPEQGLAVLDAIAPFHASNASLHATRGRLLLLAGERGKAVAAFDRALELAPQDRDLADYRRTLVAQGTSPAAGASAERWARPVDAIIAATEDVAPAPQGATGLFERQAIQVFQSGLSSTFRQVVIRVDSDATAEQFQRFDVAYTPGEDRVEIIEAEVVRDFGLAKSTRLRPVAIQDLRQDGKSGGVYTLQAAKVVRFPAMRAGDVMHLQIRTDEIGSRNLFGDYFGAIVPLSAEFPRLRAELIVEAPVARALYSSTQSVPPGVREVQGETQILRFSADDVPAIAPEPGMPGYGDVGAWVSVSTFQAWDDMARWYRQLVRAQLAVPPELAATAKKLVADVGGDQAPLRDRVAAIHGWVIKNTRYVGIEFGIHGYKPYSVSEIVKRGYGDCKDKAALLVAMGRSVGIPIDFVLVRTRDLGRLDGTPATLRAFNHAIAYVPGLDLYLDGTAELSGLDELPELDQGAQVLRMDLYADQPPVLTQIPMQTTAVNTVIARAQYTLAADGDATARYDETIRGSTAARLRTKLQDPVQRDQVLASIIAAQHPGTQLVRAGFKNLDVPGAPVGIEAEVVLPKLGVVRGNTMEVPLVLEPGLKLRTYGSLSARRHPLAFTAIESETSEDVYRLPAGWSVKALPEPVTLKSAFGVFSIDVERAGATLLVKQRYEPTATRIAAEDYPAWRQFLSDMARAESVRLVLVGP